MVADPGYAAGGWGEIRETGRGGLGEPMFLFEGISAWPTVALRLLAVLISISALTWGWRKLRINRAEIETTFHLRLHMRQYEMTLWGQVRRLLRRGKGWSLRR